MDSKSGFRSNIFGCKFVRNVVANLAARSKNRHGRGSIVGYMDNSARWVPGETWP